MSRCGDCPCWVKERCTEDLTDSECIDKLQDSLWEYSNEFGQRAEPKQEWIPCSERLPSEDASVIAQYSDGSIAAIKHARPSYWNHISTHRIVAWMPLPGPWEGVE